jgi:hypothetical protein
MKTCQIIFVSIPAQFGDTFVLGCLLQTVLKTLIMFMSVFAKEYIVFCFNQYFYFKLIIAHCNK